MPALKAFIVEDSPVILENLIATLEELAQVEVVGSVADEAGAVRWMSRDPDANADLFIVDVFLRSLKDIFAEARRRPHRRSAAVEEP